MRLKKLFAWYQQVSATPDSFNETPDLAAFSLTNTTNNLEWTEVDNATAYELERDTDSGFGNATVVYTGANTTYTDTGIQSTLYYYRVKATASGYTDSDYSNTAQSTMGEIGALFWLRGDNLTLTDEVVLVWPDKSLSNDAAKVASRTAPSRLAAQINGHDVVDYVSASNTIHEIAAINNITTYTAYVVFKADSVTGVRSLLGQVQNGAGTFLNTGFNFLISTNTVVMTNRDGTGQQSQNFAFTDTASYHVLMVKFNSAGAGISELLAKMDGVTAKNVTGLNSISANNNKLYIGAFLGSGADDFDGKLAEIIFFTEYQSNIKQRLLHNYLKTRYAFSYDFLDDGFTGGETLTSITYSSSIDAITDLFARVCFDDVADQPILLLMHGFNQSATDFDDLTLQRFKEYGFFVAAVGMRGRNSADGSQDASAREIYDMYDAITHIRTTYADNVDPNRVVVIGYSGGGGNVLGFVSRFPDVACLAVDFFGISDYGYATGYYQEEAGQQATLQTWIGGTPAAKPNEYKARQHAWSASNCKGKLRIYHDDADTSVLVAHSRELETQLIADGFTNYVYSESESGDPERWLHGLPNTGETGEENIDAEDQFIAEAFTLDIPELANSGTLKINGGVHTSLFRIWLGNGTAANDTQNRRGTVVYNYSSNSYTITPLIDAPATDMTVEIEILSGVHSGKTASGTISSETLFTPA